MAEINDSGTKLKRNLDRKVYNDEGLDDDEIDGKRTFDVLEKLNSDQYNDELVKVVNGEDINVKYFQENGFKQPMLVKDKTGLGIRVPSQSFSVEEVKKCVGSRRTIDVLDVTTQKAMEMTMKDWVKYYEDKNDRSRLLNVLSLECSHSRLENYVEQPEFVRQIDWVDNVWPRHLKDKQTETTNVLDKMHYPKVQRYCLMSVKGCYTDFHIDMGGTSVWYHILHGAKVFWLIPPTEKNLTLYEDWVLSGKQGDEFFADKVEKCERLRLEEGWTFFIPTGWIHGVYTPEDSLVFGGNYMHSFSMSLQLRIWDIENKTHVPMKFRFPFFTEMHWYVLERYVSTLTGKGHRKKTHEELKEEAIESNLVKKEISSDCDTETKLSLSPSNSGSASNENEHKISDSLQLAQDINVVKLDNSLLNGTMNNLFKSEEKKSGIKVHLTKYELEGIRNIIAFLHNLPVTKRFVPKDIGNPDGLLEDSKVMLLEHSADNPDFAITGEFTLKWAPHKNKHKVRTYTTHFQARKTRQPKSNQREKGSKKLKRRVRCKQCEPCTREDCHLCHFCKDMKKFGGPGVMKQCCLSRQCIAPVLPKTAECIICYGVQVLNNPDDIDNKMMECGFCYEIVHPSCFKDTYPDITAEGVENEDLPNSWECPKCVESGKQGQGWTKEYPKAPGQERMKLSRKNSTGSYDRDEVKKTPSPAKREQSRNTPDHQSISPTGSMSSNISTLSTTSSVKLNNSHQYEGLREVTVQIERLKDIDSLSNSSWTPAKRSESPFKKQESPKPEISASKFYSSPPKKTQSTSEEIASFSIVKSSPTVSHKSEDRLCTLVSRERRLTRSSSVHSDCSQENKTPPTSRTSTPNGRLNSSAQEIQISTGRKTPLKQDKTTTNGFSLPTEIKTGNSTLKEQANKQEQQNKVNGRTTSIVKRYPRRMRNEVEVSNTSDEEQTPKKRAKTEVTPAAFKAMSPTTLRSPPPPIHSSASSSEESPVEGDQNTPMKAGQRSSQWSTQSELGQRSNMCSAQSKQGPRLGLWLNNSKHGCKGSPDKAFSWSVQGRNSNKWSTSTTLAGQGSSVTFIRGNRTNPKTHNSDWHGSSSNVWEGKGYNGNNYSGKRKRLNHDIEGLKPCKTLVQKYVIRPAPVITAQTYVQLNNGRNHALNQAGWVAVFRHLQRRDLLKCLQVCKTFYRWGMNNSLWSAIDLSCVRIGKSHLSGIVKRQPSSLDLSYSNISFRQVEWLLARLPHLKELNMTGNSWAAVSALCSITCPLLTHLDLSWVSGIYDLCIQDLLSPPLEQRPGLDDNRSRLRNCTTFSLVGSAITEDALRIVHQNIPKIDKLVLSSCTRITDRGLSPLADMVTLTELDVSKCRNLTPGVFEYIKKIPNLRQLNIMACMQISEKDIGTFARDIGGKYLRRPCVVLIQRSICQLTPSAINGGV